MSKDQREAFDIIIVGGGQVGMLAALTLARFFPDLDLCLVEAFEFGQSKDPRATALSPGAVNMLDQLDCWRPLEQGAAPISAMKITDSELSDKMRPVFLQFNASQDHRGVDEPIGHIVDNQQLNAALAQAVRQADIVIRDKTKVTRLSAEGRELSAIVGADEINQKLRARLILAADGANSRLRDWAGIKVFRHDYDQMGLVGTIIHERDHKGVAFEHFLPDGPFATLPLDGKSSSIVWALRSDEAQKLAAADIETQTEALNKTMGTYLGRAEIATRLQPFKLDLCLAKNFYKGGLVLIGDAAHKIHPLAGQGLNMGFADVAALADALAKVRYLGLPIDDQTMLDDYQRARHFDTIRKAATTDILNRLFSNDVGAVRFLRDTGVGVLNNLEGVKAQIIQQASGTGDNEPGLMRGFRPGSG